MITRGAQELKLHTSWSYHLGKGGRDVEGQVDVPVLWLEHRCHSLSVPFVLPWDTRSADSESMGSDAKFLAEAEEQEPSRQTTDEEGGDQSLEAWTWRDGESFGSCSMTALCTLWLMVP